MGETFDENYLSKVSSIERFADSILSYIPNMLLPGKMVKIKRLKDFFDIVRYDKKYALEDIPNVKKFYVGHSVSVSSKARGLGIGKELIRRTMTLAKEKGCAYVYILATGIYSQAIFKSLGFTLLKEKVYEEFKDYDGTEFFCDMREHKKAQVVAYDLSNF